MAIRMQITPDHVKAAKLVRPGWYKSRVAKIVEEVSKDKESNNIVVDLVGMEGDAKDVPCKVWFSEKFPQGAIPFVKACGARVTEEEGVDPSFDFEKQTGRVVNAHWVTNRGKDGTGKPSNSIDDWGPLAATDASAEAPVEGAFEQA